MDLDRRVRLAMDDAIQAAKDQEEEQRMREGLLKHGFDEKQLEGVNLAGLRALFHRECENAGPQANDRQMAFDARSKSIAARYGVSAPRKL